MDRGELQPKLQPLGVSDHAASGWRCQPRVKLSTADLPVEAAHSQRHCLLSLEQLERSSGSRPGAVLSFTPSGAWYKQHRCPIVVSGYEPPAGPQGRAVRGVEMDSSGGQDTSPAGADGTAPDVPDNSYDSYATGAPDNPSSRHRTGAPADPRSGYPTGSPGDPYGGYPTGPPADPRSGYPTGPPDNPYGNYSTGTADSAANTSDNTSIGDSAIGIGSAGAIIGDGAPPIHGTGTAKDGSSPGPGDPELDI